MKKKIVIASVLKPIDDVRAFWKLSQSIAKTNKYEVNIIGNVSKKEPCYENVKFHPHSLRRDNWIKRWLIREKILFKIIAIKPAVLIITTHELINIGLLAKLITGCKIIYDIQENYFLNLSELSTSAGKKIYASLVRLKEKFSRYFISEYWLAEHCYMRELSFAEGKNEVIENKAFEHPFKDQKSEDILVLFSGTISEYGGIFRAIHFYKKLLEYEPLARLLIIGQIHESKLKIKLEKEADKLPGLKLQISFDPIPHQEILHAISTASIGVIGYEPNQVNAKKMPTKLYEYSRYRLPYLVEKNTVWSKKGSVLGGAIPIDFGQISIEKVLEKLRDKTDLFNAAYPIEETWEVESLKVITSLKKLINYN